jgi:hypothetical protein
MNESERVPLGAGVIPPPNFRHGTGKSQGKIYNETTSSGRHVIKQNDLRRVVMLDSSKHQPFSSTSPGHSDDF